MGIMTGFRLDYNPCGPVVQHGKLLLLQEFREVLLCLRVILRTGLWPGMCKQPCQKKSQRSRDDSDQLPPT